MGTTTEWMHVLELSVVFGVLTLLWDVVTEGKSFARLPNILAIAVGGFAFGMLMVFGWWPVFHGRLAILSSSVVLIALAAGFINRRARRRQGRL